MDAAFEGDVRLGPVRLAERAFRLVDDMSWSSLVSWRTVTDRYAPLVFLTVLVAALALTTRGFASSGNLINVARQHAIIIVLATGQTIVMISGGIDLSVGSMLALSGVVSAQMASSGQPIVLSLCAGIGVGFVGGLINGLVATKAKVPAFIATLGMMGMARGIALWKSNGSNVDLPEGFRTWCGEHGFFLAVLFVGVMVVVAFGAHVLLSYTVLGKRCYAIGGNREAARLSGIAIDRHVAVIFALNGLIAGLAGVMMLAYAGIGNPTAGEGYELDSVAAAVIGGTSLFGGQGNIGGTVVGAFILAVLRNGCDLRDIPDHPQRFIVGLMTIAAVFYDRLRRKN